MYDLFKYVHPEWRLIIKSYLEVDEELNKLLISISDGLEFPVAPHPTDIFKSFFRVPPKKVKVLFISLGVASGEGMVFTGNPYEVSRKMNNIEDGKLIRITGKATYFHTLTNPNVILPREYNTPYFNYDYLEDQGFMFLSKAPVLLEFKTPLHTYKIWKKFMLFVVRYLSRYNTITVFSGISGEDDFLSYLRSNRATDIYHEYSRIQRINHDIQYRPQVFVVDSTNNSGILRENVVEGINLLLSKQRRTKIKFTRQ